MTNGSSHRLVLPSCPPTLVEQAQSGAVAWVEPVTMDTYATAEPTRFPVFYDSRVYQGSTGRVYPLPLIERVSSEKHPQTWSAVHLENAHLRVMVLPELGGRIHVVLDKATGYDLIYRQNVIKPALVGLAGPWLSGGIELNWPQHHRPATYRPVDVEIEQNTDGSVTVWCSDHDPLQRMKGMHGVSLHPGSSLLELKVRLYNRTETTQTFLWWANAAARVNPEYQAFFPTDVQHVYDHAKRATSTYPVASGTYYGIDYPNQVTPDDPLADRLDWYRNIPVPTSYMATGTKDDFFGGYDHLAGSGFVCWADHHLAPGKKLWTWGRSTFGDSWERNLTDDDGPYVELMSGAYTDNQPDFSYLQPGETRAFSQYWYPLSAIGPAHQATREVAVHLSASASDSTVTVGVNVTRSRPGTTIRVFHDTRVLGTWQADVSPDDPFLVTLDTADPLAESALRIVVENGGEILLSWQRAPLGDAPAPPPATEPLLPDAISSVEELFLTGTQLWQNRHATRPPEPYWERALELDPADSRSHLAMCGQRYAQGDYGAALAHATAAVARITVRTPNPGDGSAQYWQGLAARKTGDDLLAYEAFAHAAWSRGFRAPALFALAELDGRGKRYAEALLHLDECLVADPDHLQARVLRSLVLQRLSLPDDALRELATARSIDPLDWWAAHAAGRPLTCDSATCLDVSAAYQRAGFASEALDVLERADELASSEPHSGTLPLIRYRRAALLLALGDSGAAAAALAQEGPSDYCFPWLLEDHDALLTCLEAQPDDATALQLLASFLYARGRREEAFERWTSAVKLAPGDPVAWRCLGLAAFNVVGDAELALECYESAVRLAPADGRLLFEHHQLLKLTGRPPAQRLQLLRQRDDLVRARDDLSLELAELAADTGDLALARQTLESRHFQPWEGGEGRVIGAWESVLCTAAEDALAAGLATRAAALIAEAVAPPASLGETQHPLANQARLWLTLGDALAATEGQDPTTAWARAADAVGDFRDMAVSPYSEVTVYSIAACRRLGRDRDAEDLAMGLGRYAREVQEAPAILDFFATSLPESDVFTVNLEQRRQQRGEILLAGSEWGQGGSEEALARLGAVLAADPSSRSALELARFIARSSR